MIGIIYSTNDPASVNIAEYIISRHGQENETFRLYKIDSELTGYDYADELGFETIFFLSKHRSAEGVASITTHATGNWNTKNELGGKPKSLSVAAPLQMLSFISMVNETKVEIERTYEATHHGPLLKTPSLWVELGGDEEAIRNKEYAAIVADAAYESAMNGNATEYERVAIGIGSNHYPEKFTRLALEKKYAFAHIMPRYAIYNDDGSENSDMLKQAMERSAERPDLAVIEWKGINASTREMIIKKLGDIGLDYERV
jgi:D-tyrosyl-tRNA(Tyr) deacylase